MSFQIRALSFAQFEPLFTMSDNALTGARATRLLVDSKPGYPCRVSLAEAEIGETVVLVNFVHQPADSPFQAAHAIYIRENAEQAFPEPDTVPELLEHRLISIRAFDKKHFIVSADVIQGTRLDETIPALFHDPSVAYLHLHNAKLGCFIAQATRD